MFPMRVDVRTIRERMHLTQTAFALRFGFTTAAGSSDPGGPRRAGFRSSVQLEENGASTRAEAA